MVWVWETPVFRPSPNLQHITRRRRRHSSRRGRTRRWSSSRHCAQAWLAPCSMSMAAEAHPFEPSFVTWAHHRRPRSKPARPYQLESSVRIEAATCARLASNACPHRSSAPLTRRGVATRRRRAGCGEGIVWQAPVTASRSSLQPWMRFVLRCVRWISTTENQLASSSAICRLMVLGQQHLLQQALLQMESLPMRRSVHAPWRHDGAVRSVPSVQWNAHQQTGAAVFLLSSGLSLSDEPYMRTQSVMDTDMLSYGFLHSWPAKGNRKEAHI